MSSKSYTWRVMMAEMLTTTVNVLVDDNARADMIRGQLRLRDRPLTFKEEGAPLSWGHLRKARIKSSTQLIEWCQLQSRSMDMDLFQFMVVSTHAMWQAIPPKTDGSLNNSRYEFYRGLYR